PGVHEGDCRRVEDGASHAGDRDEQHHDAECGGVAEPYHAESADERADGGEGAPCAAVSQRSEKRLEHGADERRDGDERGGLRDGDAEGGLKRRQQRREERREAVVYEVCEREGGEHHAAATSLQAGSGGHAGKLSWDGRGTAKGRGKRE